VGAGRFAPALTALVLLALALYSAGPVLADPRWRVWGAQADTVHHVWGHWWALQQPWSSGSTQLVSFPFGEEGSLLVPLGTLLLRPLAALAGPHLAYNLLSLLYLLFAPLAVALCAHRATGTRRAACFAALAMFVGRPLFVTLGLGNTEGIAVGWLALALWASMDWVKGRHGWRSSLLVGALYGVAVIEAPYALPLALPLAVGVAILRARHPGRIVAVVMAAGAGLLPPLTRLLMLGEGLGGSPSEPKTVIWLGSAWEYVDFERFDTASLVWPLPVFDFNLPTTRDAIVHGGHTFLGISVLLFAALSLRGRTRWPLLMAGFCGLLAIGSVPWGMGGLPGPFLILNGLMDTVFPLLSQPIRFLPFCSAALALAAAIGLETALAKSTARRGRLLALAAAATMVLEALITGGPSLSIPTMMSRDEACLGQLNGGAVHRLAPPEQNDLLANAEALRLQTIHQRPGTHRGIGGWKHHPREESFDRLLEGLERSFLDQCPELFWEHAARLERQGVHWLLVPIELDSRWLGEAELSCGGYRAYSLATAERASIPARPDYTTELEPLGLTAPGPTDRAPPAAQQ
jgi:hypothetical protein